MSLLPPGSLTQLLVQLADVPSVELPTPEPMPGDVLGRFRLEREIGRGGFGRVYCATDLELGREVALKVIRPGRGRAMLPNEAVQREAEAAAQLRHRGIVTLHDAGRCEWGAYLVYELLRGETLQERTERGRLPAAEAQRILCEVAAALAHAHAAGVVHRDVKPGNIFLEEDGGVKLLDLGLAQVAGAIGVAAGSPQFMAPEQGQEGTVDARADVFAWGVLVGLLLDGEIPPARLEPPGPRAPTTLRGLGALARSQDPAHRPADASALCASLQTIARTRRRFRIAGAAVLGVALAALPLLTTLLRPGAPPPPPLRLAVADATGDDQLSPSEELTALVTHELEGFPGLAVVDRARITGVLRATGKPSQPPLDGASVAFAARQVGGAAVLVPGVRHLGGAVVLTLEARDPVSGEVLASASAHLASVDEVHASAMGPLVRKVVTALEVRQRDPKAAQVALDRAVTASLEAHRQYTAGLRCEEEPSRGESWNRLDCTSYFQHALAFDPDFPLARFALARRAVLDGTPPEELRAMLRSALERLEMVPPRERAQLMAWKAGLDGKPEEAIAILRRAQADWSDDARLAFALGKALKEEGRLAEAVASLERAVQLDPGLEVATEELALTLGRLDRVDDLRRLADRLAALPPYPGTLHAEIGARGWAGDFDGALRVARRAARGGGAAREDLVLALAAAGQLDEAEALLRASDPKPGSLVEIQLARLLQLAGRRREALVILERPLPAGAPLQQRVLTLSRRAWRLAESRDGPALVQVAEAMRRDSLELAAKLAPVMAYAGAIEPALALAPSMPGQPSSGRLLAALVTWRRGDAAAALPELRWAAGHEWLDVAAPLPPEAPAWLAAECALEVEPPERALAHLRRFQRTYRPLSPWRIWAYPRSLLVEARLLDRLGRRGEAQAALTRLEALWAHADRDLPLLAEARALRRQLGPGGGSAAPAAVRPLEPAGVHP